MDSRRLGHVPGGPLYLNGLKSKIKNQRPIITEWGVNATPPEDQYCKACAVYQHSDVVRYFNQQTGMDLTPVFDQYLRHPALPTLELKFEPNAGNVSYRWKADEPSFAMPVRVGTKGHWEAIHPTTTWKTMKTSLSKEEFRVATDLYYVNVSKW